MEQVLSEILNRNIYPGRGIALGLSPDGTTAVVVYFIMGRSANSRNRIFEKTENNGIRTTAADPARLENPELIIYSPVQMFGADIVVTNGNQTDTILAALKDGGTFQDALQTRTFEPDAPHYTPRISGILRCSEGSFSYSLSILKTRNGDPSHCVREFFAYDRPLCGAGHFIHTYRPAEGDILPSFEGAPIAIGIPNDIKTFADEIWQAMDAENKIALFVRSITRDREVEDIIFNKYAK